MSSPNIQRFQNSKCIQQKKRPDYSPPPKFTCPHPLPCTSSFPRILQTWYMHPVTRLKHIYTLDVWKIPHIGHLKNIIIPHEPNHTNVCQARWQVQKYLVMWQKQDQQHTNPHWDRAVMGKGNLHCYLMTGSAFTCRLASLQEAMGKTKASRLTTLNLITAMP